MKKPTFNRIVASLGLLFWIFMSVVVWKYLGVWAGAVFALPSIYLLAVSIRGSWKLARSKSKADIFLVLRRISGRHLKYHMVYPLAIGALLEFALIYWEQPVWLSWAAVLKTLTNMAHPQHVIPVLGVVLTYVVLLYRFVIRKPLMQQDPKNVTTVLTALEEATSYIALSPVRLKDWFKPNYMVYFSMLLENKRSAEQKQQKFDYQRVMVFARERDYGDATAQILDLPYAKALSRLHQDFQIPLAYITEDEVAKVLSTLGPKGRPILANSSAWPAWLIEFLKLYKRRPWVFHLDFALIAGPRGKIVVVGPTQTEKAILVDDNDQVSIYEKIVTEIQKATHRNGSVRTDHDFVKLINSL